MAMAFGQGRAESTVSERGPTLTERLNKALAEIERAESRIERVISSINGVPQQAQGGEISKISGSRSLAECVAHLEGVAERMANYSSALELVA